LTQDILDSTHHCYQDDNSQPRADLGFQVLTFCSCFLLSSLCVLLFFLPRSSIEANSRLSCVPLDIGLLNGLNLMHSEDQPIWTIQSSGCLIPINRSGTRNNMAVWICLGRTSPRDNRPGQPWNGSPGLATCMLPRIVVFILEACQRPWTCRPTWIIVVIASQLKLHRCETSFTLTACTHELA
jgi:hypothetical protein